MEANGKIRLIDATALKDNLCAYCQSVNPLYALECNGGECSALRIIDDMPTISQMVKESEEKAMTNADKIRNMTVNELCEFICSVSTNCQNCRFKDGGCNLVEWIDGEVEEVENDND